LSLTILLTIWRNHGNQVPISPKNGRTCPGCRGGGLFILTAISDVAEIAVSKGDSFREREILGAVESFQIIEEYPEDKYLNAVGATDSHAPPPTHLIIAQ